MNTHKAESTVLILADIQKTKHALLGLVHKKKVIHKGISHLDKITKNKTKDNTNLQSAMKMYSIQSKTFMTKLKTQVVI